MAWDVARAWRTPAVGGRLRTDGASGVVRERGGGGTAAAAFREAAEEGPRLHRARRGGAHRQPSPLWDQIADGHGPRLQKISLQRAPTGNTRRMKWNLSPTTRHARHAHAHGAPGGGRARTRGHAGTRRHARRPQAAEGTRSRGQRPGHSRPRFAAWPTVGTAPTTSPCYLSRSALAGQPSRDERPWLVRLSPLRARSWRRSTDPADPLFIFRFAALGRAARLSGFGSLSRLAQQTTTPHTTTQTNHPKPTHQHPPTNTTSPFAARAPRGLRTDQQNRNPLPPTSPGAEVRYSDQQVRSTVALLTARRR